MSFPIPTDSGQCQPSRPSHNLLILIFLRNNQPWYVWAFFVWERARIGGIKAETIPSVTAIRQIAVKRRRKVGFDWSNASTHLSSRQICICPQDKYTFVLKTNTHLSWTQMGNVEFDLRLSSANSCLTPSMRSKRRQNWCGSKKYF